VRRFDVREVVEVGPRDSGDKAFACLVGKGSCMRRPLGQSLGLAGVGLVFSLILCGWSAAETDAEAPARDAEEKAAAPGAPQPEEPPFAPRPVPAEMLALNTVVAMVNGEAITLDELQRHSNPILAVERAKWSPQEWAAKKEEILRWRLDGLIDRKLILMEAKERGERVQESRVREFIMGLPELKMSFDGDLAKFLVAKGITYRQLYKEAEEFLLFGKIIQQNVTPRVRVPPEEVRRQYERNIDKFTEEAAVHCFAMTFMKRDNPEAGAALLSKMNEALRKINEGAYFPDVAKEYSEDPLHAEKGGDWGWITPGTLEEKASEAAFALKEGQYSGIVEGNAAYWILWAKEKRDSSVIPLSAAWKEIELDIRARRREEEIRKWGQRLRLKAAITYPMPLSEILRK